jgi:hypothetical protein
MGESPKWLFTLDGSNQILIALSLSMVIFVGTLVMGPSFMFTVVVPLTCVELLNVLLIIGVFKDRS